MASLGTCRGCTDEVTEGISCTVCNDYFHPKCAGMPVTCIRSLLKVAYFNWFCNDCGAKYANAAVDAAANAGVNDISVTSQLVELRSLVKDCTAKLSSLSDKVESNPKNQYKPYRNRNSGNVTLPTSNQSNGSSQLLYSQVAKTYRPKSYQQSKSIHALPGSLPKRDRRFNLIISGAPEPDPCTTPHAKVQSDRDLLMQMCDTLDVDPDPNLTVHRVGEFSVTADRPRLIKATFSSDTTRSRLLHNSSKLKQFDNTRSIYVHPDLSPKLRAQRRELVSELKRQRESGRDVIIKQGKIVERLTIPAADVSENEALPGQTLNG